MKKLKIKEKEEIKKVVKKTFYVTCPECPKEITGTSAGQVEYNLKLHLEAHKKEKKR